jgi:hypothetical protein
MQNFGMIKRVVHIVTTELQMVNIIVEQAGSAINHLTSVEKVTDSNPAQIRTIVKDFS